MWFINPFTQTVRVETKLADGYAMRRLQTGRLDSAVLSGLWIDVGWLWLERLPSKIGCLDEILGK
jgi:hypothetical protein